MARRKKQDTDANQSPPLADMDGKVIPWEGLDGADNGAIEPDEAEMAELEATDPEIARIANDARLIEEVMGPGGPGELADQEDEGFMVTPESLEDLGEDLEDEDGDGDEGDGENEEVGTSRFMPNTRRVYTPEEIEQRDRRAAMQAKNKVRVRVKPVKTEGEDEDEPPTVRGKAGRPGAGSRMLPPPPVFKFDDNRKQAIAKPAKFWEYWRNLEGLDYARGRLIVYVYRIYPVLKDGARQVGKMAEWFPMSQLVKLYGAGDYHLKLNDAAMNSRTLAMCSIRNVGDRNWTEYPPVLNPEDLELDDPLNRPYITWARSRGIPFPGDAIYEANKRSKEEREQEMAEANITSRVVNRAFDMLERGRGDDDVPQSALAKSIELISRAGEVQSKILEKGIDRAMELQTRRGSENPLREAVELVKSLQAERGPGADIQGIVETILQMESKHSDKLFQIQMEQQRQRDQEISHLRGQLEKLMERAQNPQGGGNGREVVPAKTLKDQLTELKEMKDVIREALGIEDDAGKGASQGWVEHLPLILQAGTVLVGSVASIVHNLAVVQGKGGAVVAPPPVDAALTPEQQAAMQSMGMGGAQGMGQATGTPQGPPQTHGGPQGHPSGQAGQQQADQGNAMTRAHQFFATITIPLTRSYNAGESGAEFAARLVDLTESGYFGEGVTGTQIYDQVLEFGQPLVGSLIQTYPPIWNVVGQTPAKWERFLTEFFRAREIWAATEQDDGDGEPVEGIVEPSTPTPGKAT